MDTREQSALPLPVAALLRRAHNAKSPKDRHDTAYFAWEVSVRLAVAARPPADLRPLAHGSVGQWVRAVDAGGDPLDAQPLLDVYGLATEVGAGKRHAPQSVTARKLLDALPAYRNQVIGHGSTRAADFYRDASDALIRGLEAAWACGVFLPAGARLLFAEAVELDTDGTRRARLLDLSGVMSQVLDPLGTPGVPEHVLPDRVYLRVADEYRSLHPLVLYRGAELAEQVLFFNGLRRRAAYLDYASGEALRGDALEEALAGVELDAFALFSQARDDTAAPEEPEDPDLFGDYRLLGKLGEGAMGVVYLARQQSLERLVALKMLAAREVHDATSVARFRREMAALARCDHPNVVKILASGESQGTHYYAMEYFEGADLAQVAKALSSSHDFDTAVSTATDHFHESRAAMFEGVPQAPRTAPPSPARPSDRYRQLAESLRDAALGLHHLHEAGIVHRDVKPANLLVTAAEHRVVVMDLSLAAMGDDTLSITRDKGAILGTLRYMPPEQLQRNLLQVDHRADIYSLGATFYELLTGRPFFDGDSEARLIEQVLREDPVPTKRANPAVPDDLATIVGKATEKDARLRYESAAALADDVDAYLAGRPIRAKPPTLGYVLRLAVRRNRALAATVAVAVALVVALAAVFVSSLADERDRAVRAEGVAENRRAEADQQRLRAIEQESLAREALERAEAERDQKDIALNQRDRALEQSQHSLRTARALALVSASEGAQSANSMRALILAREAVKLAERTETVSRLHAAATQVVEVAILAAHGNDVYSASFSPDGTRILTASLDGTARVWDSGGVELSVLRHRELLSSAEFSPDGSHVLTAGEGITRIWTPDGRILGEDKQHLEIIVSAAFSPDGTRILTVSRSLEPSDETMVRVADLEGAGTVIARGWNRDMKAAAFSPDGRTVAVSVEDGTIHILEADGGERAVLRGHEASATSAAFSPDGRRIVTTWLDGTARIWDAEGVQRAVLAGHEQPVRSAAFSHDGALVLTVSESDVRIWDAEGDEVAVLRGHGNSIMSAAFSADDTRVVTTSEDRTARVWDCRGNELAVLRGHTDRVWFAEFSTDGARVATASVDGTARIWDLGTVERSVLRHGSPVACASFSADGNRVLTGAADGTARVWHQPGKGPNSPRDHERADAIVSVAVAHDGAQFATACSNGDVVIEQPTGEFVKWHVEGVTSVAFAPDDGLVVTASSDRVARVWDMRGTEVARMGHPSLIVSSAQFSRDGLQVLTSSWDGTARVWDLEGRELLVLRGHEAPVTAAAYSPDRKRIATASWDRTVQIWTSTGSRRSRLRGHDDRVTAVAFSPDGTQVVSASLDGTARIWGFVSDGVWGMTGREFAVLRVHGMPVSSAVFSPDGSRVLTASWDGTARIWFSRTIDLLAAVDARVTRELTPEERDTYKDLLGD